MRAPAFTRCLLLAVPLLAACGNAESGTSTTGGGGGGEVTPEPLAAPEVGMQLKSTKVSLASGAEQYTCWSYQVPADGDISLVEIAAQVPTTGVHHWAVFTNTDPIKSAGPYECSTMGVSWGLVSGGGVGTPGFDFPKGTAMNLKAGQHIIFQLHLLNTTTAELDIPTAYMNLVGTKETNLQPVGLLIAGTLDITLPPHSTNVPATGSCTLGSDMPNIFSVFPHMHQRGVHITAQQTLKAGGTPIMLSDHTWDFHDQGVYPVTGSAVAGDQITVTCYYDNPGATTVGFGLNTKNEMCVDVLYYYPATTVMPYCGLE